MLTSVLLPCWNAAELTRVCLDRLGRFTRGRWELVAVDDGSSDETGRLLRAFVRAARPPLERAAVLVNRRNRGYPAAMNRALAAARGGRVVFANTDAAVTEGWLEAMAAAFAAEPLCAAAAPASNRPPRRLGAAPPWAWPPRYRDLAGLDRFAAAMSLRPPGPAFVPEKGFAPGFWLMADAKAVGSLGGFDERYAPGGFEDWDLQWRLRRAGGLVGHAPRAFVHHAGFASGARNGLSAARLYGKRRRRLLTERFPETAALELATLCPV